MSPIMTESQQQTDFKYVFSRIVSGLGAFGVALQNYPAVELFIKGFISMSEWSKWLVKLGALSSGGLCSGVVNYWMNVKLLDGFFERMNSNKDYRYKTLSLWEQWQYFSGIGVFVMTGMLFGLMAFTFALEGPLAILSIAAGIFVAAIMTVQEVETWLLSYDSKETTSEETLSAVQQLGKICGHVIAAGNVLALSFLFTLGLAQSLIMIGMAAFPALVVGAAVAFTFGAFTEYFFYDAYLADFCKDFSKKWQDMRDHEHPWFGLVCVSTNALVNAALTYAGAELLTSILIAAHIALPPVVALTAISAVLALFAGSASFILGMDFWISPKPQTEKISVANNPSALFSIKEDKSAKTINGERLFQTL